MNSFQKENYLKAKHKKDHLDLFTSRRQCKKSHTNRQRNTSQHPSLLIAFDSFDMIVINMQKIFFPKKSNFLPSLAEISAKTLSKSSSLLDFHLLDNVAHGLLVNLRWSCLLRSRQVARIVRWCCCYARRRRRPIQARTAPLRQRLSFIARGSSRR